ncbi:MAG TPA: permease, partial [Lentisphaeria bacterium]|nr:permease [Lentisphaeria bacterium]
MHRNPYASPNAFAGAPVLAEAWERAAFIRKTYLHLGLAILAFTGLECALMVSPLPDMMMKMLSGSGYAWLAVLGVFMLVGWMARAFACSEQPLSMQYIGLGLYVVAQAIIFVPLLTYAIRFSNPDVLPTAAVLTLTLFAGLTGVVLVTRKDFSFLRSLLMVGGF